MEQHVRLAAGRVRLAADLAVPATARGVVLFAHGSGSGRLSPRNRLVAARLQQAGLATLVLDLLTAEEKKAERAGGRLRFDVQLLAGRLAAARRLEELADHCQRIATRSSSDPVARRSPTGWCP